MNLPSSLSEPSSSGEPARPREPSKLGRHRLLVPLGAEAVCDVHLAISDQHGGLPKLLVVKELHATWGSDARLAASFYRLAAKATLLNHPNVAQVLEVGQREKRSYLCLEFLRGETLRRIIADSEDGPPIPLAVRLQIHIDALSGLHHAHEAKDLAGSPLGLVHGSFGAAHVVVTYDGHVKVSDFVTQAIASRVKPLSPGQLDYVTPEQLAGKSADRRSDIFNAGALLWELVTLRRFFPPGGEVKDALRSLTERCDHLERISPGMDRELLRICERALHPAPEARYASAEELRAALSDYTFSRFRRLEPAAVAAILREKFRDQRDELEQLVQGALDTYGRSTELGVEHPLAVPAGAPAARRATSAVVEPGGARCTALDEPFPPPSQEETRAEQARLSASDDATQVDRPPIDLSAEATQVDRAPTVSSEEATQVSEGMTVFHDPTIIQPPLALPEDLFPEEAAFLERASKQRPHKPRAQSGRSNFSPRVLGAALLLAALLAGLALWTRDTMRQAPPARAEPEVAPPSRTTPTAPAGGPPSLAQREPPQEDAPGESGESAIAKAEAPAPKANDRKESTPSSTVSVPRQVGPRKASSARPAARTQGLLDGPNPYR